MPDRQRRGRAHRRRQCGAQLHLRGRLARLGVSRKSFRINFGELGFSSSRSLHLRAESRCDTGANRIRSALNSVLADDTTATLRAKFRWLRGSPEPLLRLKGNWLEATVRMSVPPNLGTPGLPNSRRVANAGPAIHQVTHSPALPGSDQDATVWAQVSDPNGLAALVVKYRVDPSTNFTGVGMTYKDRKSVV